MNIENLPKKPRFMVVVVIVVDVGSESDSLRRLVCTNMTNMTNMTKLSANQKFFSAYISSYIKLYIYITVYTVYKYYTRCSRLQPVLTGCVRFLNSNKIKKLQPQPVANR